ncbi:MAG: AraC family transcriptional regulator [Myxococcota bacterium]
MGAANEEGWIRRAPGRELRIEACLVGNAYSRHRHDDYVFALTLGGVQSFDYRGATRHSLAGEVVVLHPDELHDGRAGTEVPFRYRALNVAPSRLREALGGGPLPHLPGGTSRDERLVPAVRALLQDFDRPLEPLEFDSGLSRLAAALSSASGASDPGVRPDTRAVERARAALEASPERVITMDELEEVCGRSRWQLSRDFRRVFGTSPYRYQVLRRLHRAKALLEQGRGGAEVAARCGFSDQAHLIRQFRQTYGLSPRQWCRLLGRGEAARTIVQ